MKVETKLAHVRIPKPNCNGWAGLAELARFVLAQQLALGCEPYDSLNQIWAGGPGDNALNNPHRHRLDRCRTEQ